MVSFQRVGIESCDLWQQFLNTHPDATAYHHFGWGQAIQEAYGHKPHYFMAKSNDEVVGLLPVLEIVRPILTNQFCSLPFCDVGGTLAKSDDIARGLIDFASESLGISEKTPLDMRQSGAKSEELLTKENTIEGQKVRMLLPLPDSSEALMASFKSKLRSQVRKAEKNGLTYEIGRSQSLLNEFYDVFAHNMRSLGSPVHSKNLFEKLLKHYGDEIVISIVRTGDIAIGGGIVLLGEKTASIPWASTRAEYNRLAPNMMLYWSLLKHVTDAGKQQFDFGRSSFGKGTFKFKSQWGAQPVSLLWKTLPECETEDASEVAVTSGKLRGYVESIWRHLPYSMTTFIGPKVRKYISL